MSLGGPDSNGVATCSTTDSQSYKPVSFFCVSRASAEGHQILWGSSVSYGKTINIISFNVEGVKGNASSLINLSRDDSIICLQETWLWSFESNVIDCLVPNYDSFVGCSDMNDNISNFQVPRGKGRIAIMRPKSFGKLMKRITKTCLFKYIKKFISKTLKFSDKKLRDFLYSCSKHRLLVLVRTASARRF